MENSTIKNNIKDANDNYIYKYDIINSGTNKSLLNNIEVNTKTILDPTKKGQCSNISVQIYLIKLR